MQILRNWHACRCRMKVVGRGHPDQWLERLPECMYARDRLCGVPPPTSDVPQTTPSAKLEPPTQPFRNWSLSSQPDIKQKRKVIMVTKTPAFEKAVTDSRKLKAKPTQDELLEVGTRSPLPSPPFNFHSLWWKSKTRDWSYAFFRPCSSTPSSSKEAKTRPSTPTKNLVRSISRCVHDILSARPSPQGTCAITQILHPHLHTDPQPF